MVARNIATKIPAHIGVSALILGLVISLVYFHLYANRAFVKINLAVSNETKFKIYWADETQPYSEDRAVTIQVTPIKNTYSFFLTTLGNVKKLRIDLVERPGKVVLHQISITQKGYVPIIFSSTEALSRLKPLAQIEDYNVENQVLHLLATGPDPQLEVIVDPQTISSEYLVEVSRVLLLISALFFLLYYTRNLHKDYAYLSLLLILVLPLIVIMSTATNYKDIHPDEYVHVEAGAYYQDHWLPPEVDAPQIRDTYSVYGFSRLNTPEISYLIAGKFLKLIKPLKLQDYYALRLFNVLLFASLILLICGQPGNRILAIPLLISPQIWYVFSYFNSDAFAIFIMFITTIQLVNEGSTFNKYFASRKPFQATLFQVLALSLLVAILFLLKKNYYFFILFIAAYFLWKIIYSEHQNKVVILKKLGVILLVGSALIGIRLGADYYVNGLDRTQKIAAVQEEFASLYFKPSTPLAEKFFSLQPRARGMTLEALLFYTHWGDTTFRSTFGFYGYHTVAAGELYYYFAEYTLLLFLLFIVFSVFARAGRQNNILLLLVLFFSGLLIAASIYHSWVNDFQAQGRYLFPIIGMLAILLTHTIKHINYKVFSLFLLGSFLLAVHSFIYVGLIGLLQL